ncbi:MAG: hypothetical protein HUK40_21130 [Desulfobacter sp.]|nr:hypothetical protein [Desulfobacter sp.]WDP88110.1 MAG: hypothetical protein HUN05_16665 [Desulfobacter sp.]
MEMLEQIISGGQTGADQAALDTAIKFDILHGGWISKGRKTEAGPLPAKYNLKQMDTPDYPSRTRQNILDSHGTVIIARGPLKGGSRLTYSYTLESERPCCRIDLFKQDIFEAALVLKDFISQNYIQILNVAGPRASHDPAIYFDVRSVIESMLYLFYLESDAEKDLDLALPETLNKDIFPQDLEQALNLICEDLSLKTKTRIARMDNTRLKDIYFAMLDYIKAKTGIDEANLDFFNRLSGGKPSWEYTPEDGVMDIVRALKIGLNHHYSLRIL